MVKRPSDDIGQVLNSHLHRRNVDEEFLPILTRSKVLIGRSGGQRLIPGRHTKARVSPAETYWPSK